MVQIFASNEREFFIKQSFIRLAFEKDSPGVVTGMLMQQPMARMLTITLEAITGPGPGPQRTASLMLR
jgi:hypothetical protein